jgi:hypothetical protein
MQRDFSQFQQIADELGIASDKALQECAAREAINKLCSLWSEWLSDSDLTDDLLLSDINEVILNLSKWKNAIAAKLMTEPHSDSKGKGTYVVDVPCLDKQWEEVDTFDSWEEAVAFCENNFGADENGCVSLITEVE